MELTVLWFCILALQVGFTLKVVFLVVSFLQSQQWSLHSTLEKVARVGKHHRTQFLTWWKQTGPTNSRRDQELDRMRCNWIRVVWPVILFTSMLRLFVRQLQLYHGEQNGGEFDYALVVIASFALVLTSCPCLINPRCQDVWYLGSVLEIASSLSQLSFNRQLQTLGNTFAAQQQADPGTVAFNLLGLWEADGFVTCEYDQVLDAHVGSMVVVKRAIIPSTLTQSNLQNLDESRGNQSSDSLGFVALTLGQAHSRRSSRSSRSGSSPSRSKRFNRSQQPASPFQGSGCTERGAISALHELRLDSKACL
eukprot:Skav203750  [mRNA]  locus=scaffold68:559461:562063:+ [translate_table: standard]